MEESFSFVDLNAEVFTRSVIDVERLNSGQGWNFHGQPGQLLLVISDDGLNGWFLEGIGFVWQVICCFSFPSLSSPSKIELM